MLAHILKRIKKQMELNTSLQNDHACAFYEIERAHAFENDIEDNFITHCINLQFTNHNARNAMWNYLRAALRGDKEAQYKMGLSYLNGQLGLDRNYQNAEKWLSQAANQGHEEALNELHKALNSLAIS